MRHVSFIYKKKKCTLLFNCLAMLELQDKFGGINDLVDVIYNRKTGKNGKSEKITDDVEAFNFLCEIIEVLSEQSSNAKAAMDFERPEILRAAKLSALTSPTEIGLLRQAAFSAIEHGIMQETDDDESDIDLGLLELQKKTGKAK